MIMNRIALVTGASKGIGRAVAERFAKEGFSVVTCARSLHLLEDEARKHGNIDPIRADLTNDDDVKNVFDYVMQKHGKIDLLVNNAGVAMGGNMDEFPISSFDQVMNLNLRAAYLLTQLFLPVMKKQRSGHIMNISSGSGKRGNAGQTAYSASKFGMNGFGEALAKEMKPFTIKVTNICPGLVATKKYEPSFRKDRILQPEDIADLCYFLSGLPLRVNVPDVWIVPYYPIYMIKT